jgi:hypothetical protein
MPFRSLTLALLLAWLPCAAACQSFDLYPNPATGGQAHLRWVPDAPATLTLSLFNSTGRFLGSQSLQAAASGVTQTLGLDLRPLARGVYYWRAQVQANASPSLSTTWGKLAVYR